MVSEHVAEHVRAALGAAPNTIPESDSLVDWRDLDGSVPIALVIYRSQPTAWRADAIVSPANKRVLALYLDVLRGMSPDDLWLVWPKGFKADSIMVHFYLTPLGFGLPLGRPEMAVFSADVATVPATPALPDHQVLPQYPRDAERKRVVATVILQFVIDTTGHAEPASITNLKPSPGSVDFPNALSYYGEFVEAARSAVLASTYHPGRRGGCLVAQLVQAPFTFAFPP